MRMLKSRPSLRLKRRSVQKKPGKQRLMMHMHLPQMRMAPLRQRVMVQIRMRPHTVIKGMRLLIRMLRLSPANDSSCVNRSLVRRLMLT